MRSESRVDISRKLMGIKDFAWKCRILFSLFRMRVTFVTVLGYELTYSIEKE